MYTEHKSVKMNISVHCRMLQGLRGMDITVNWEKLEVVDTLQRKQERRECWCIGTHVHDGEVMPNEGIA